MARVEVTKRLGVAGWQEVMNQQAASGLSRKAFCEREGIGRSTFEKWRSRLASGSEEGTGRFVEVTPRGPRSRGWEVELALPGGVVLRMRG